MIKKCCNRKMKELWIESNYKILGIKTWKQYYECSKCFKTIEGETD